ncbi:TIGR03668 family PPOX class F420-dependent oxidoreductase [Actinopolymorpha sp. B11F2]|uniref:TIGR03668 family PPOX class F420-dependent oxidoreductase n=1 Tax=Actinopolymorpha sp. B11F2 TaxID=3160862 RepID=UPI0032E48C70
MRLTEADARARFAGGRTAHLAMADESARPHVVVVTFAAVGSVVVTAVDSKPKTTPRLHRLRLIAANPQVSILVDQYDDADWTRLWWVRGDGVAHILDTPEESAEARSWLAAKYAQYAAEPPAGPVIRIEVARWSGWAYTG